MTNNNKELIKDKSISKKSLCKQDKQDLIKYNLALIRGTGCTIEMHERIFKEILPKIINKQHARGDKNKHLVQASFLLGLDTGVPLWESVSERFGSFVVEFAGKLCRDYNCKTATEKALTQTAANAFVRTLEYSATLKHCRNSNVNTNLVKYYSMISKELDRANKQFILAITTLKQIKASPLKISVKTKEAFLAYNQQINQGNN